MRVKVRFPDELAKRARECAAEVGDMLSDWVNPACRQWRLDVFASVAKPAQTELATRETSECITIRAPKGMAAADIKAAVLACCAFCEANRVPCTPQPITRYKVEAWK